MMVGNEPFAYIQLPYCGQEVEEIARRLLPYHHCVLFPHSEDGQIERLTSRGFYYRPFSTSQDLSLEEYNDIGEYLHTLNAKRRNDILQSVQKAKNQGIEVSINLFRFSREEFEDIYMWYYDVYRPYAAIHFPNLYKYFFVEEFNAHLLKTRFIFARAKWKGKLVGGSLLSQIPCSQYMLKSSFATAFPNAPELGDVLQMYMLNSGPEPVGNINTYIYYSLIEWSIRQGYRYFSFGRENMILPPEAYLNVLGSKRAWSTTSILNFVSRSQFLLCNRAAILFLRSDYYVFHWDSNSYWLIYFANDENVPKVLSQWLSGDRYIRKVVYTRKRQVFSYLEKRGQRWNNTMLVLCNSEGGEETTAYCL